MKIAGEFWKDGDANRRLARDGDTLRLSVVYRTEPIEAENHETKKRIGLGFNKSHSMRQVASVDRYELERLISLGDEDAKTFMFGTPMEAKKALQRLLAREDLKHWKVAEGGF